MEKGTQFENLFSLSRRRRPFPPMRKNPFFQRFADCKYLQILDAVSEWSANPVSHPRQPTETASRARASREGVRTASRNVSTIQIICVEIFFVDTKRGPYQDGERRESDQDLQRRMQSVRHGVPLPSERLRTSPTLPASAALRRSSRESEDRS
jgi:hypothetical protein